MAYSFLSPPFQKNMIEFLKLQIKALQLQIQIAQIQLQILLFKEKLTVPNLPGPKFIVVHHGAGSLDFYGVNELHKQNWGFKSSLGYYIGYQYFIEYTGKVYQGRADNERAAHTVEAGRPYWWNDNSIGICLQGNFEECLTIPNQLKSLEELLNKKMTEYGIPKPSILGHRNISSTLCPGKNLYSWLLIFKGRN